MTPCRIGWSWPEKFGATPLSVDTEVILHWPLRELTRGGGADRVIELTGAYPALHQAIRVAGVGGTVIAAGFYQGPATALALGEEFHHNQSDVGVLADRQPAAVAS